jgi:hypothetical protein
MRLNDMPDYMCAVYDLIAYVTGIDGDRIIRGNQSREVLPADNDYIVYTPITQQRIGSNIETLDAEGVEPDDNAPATSAKMLRIDIQVDCYGDNGFAYADGLETFAHSGRCNEWLTQSDLPVRVLTASNPIDGTLVDDTRQYVTRWITTISICMGVSFTDDIPWFEDVQVIPNPQADIPPGPGPTPIDVSGAILKNIDIEYKTKE